MTYHINPQDTFIPSAPCFPTLKHLQRFFSGSPYVSPREGAFCEEVGAESTRGKDHGLNENQRMKVQGWLERGCERPGSTFSDKNLEFCEYMTYKETAPIECPIPTKLCFEKSTATPVPRPVRNACIARA